MAICATSSFVLKQPKPWCLSKVNHGIPSFSRSSVDEFIENIKSETNLPYS